MCGGIGDIAKGVGKRAAFGMLLGGNAKSTISPVGSLLMGKKKPSVPVAPGGPVSVAAGG